MGDGEAPSLRLGNLTHMVGKGAGSQIAERQLEPSVGPLIVDLESHQSLWGGG